MATITFKGNSIKTSGQIPQVGTKIPDFSLVATDLSTVKLSDYAGKKVVFNIFPSIDTGVCAASVRKFNEIAASKKDVKVLCISKDLPFAHKRFCGAEGIENVVSLSSFKDSNFEASFNLTIAEGPLEGLFSRVLLVVDESGKIVYSEQVPEIAQEPDYEKALQVL